MNYKKTISIKVTNDIITMIEDFKIYMKNERCYDLNNSEVIRTMIYQRWSELPAKYQLKAKI